jgi:hypothetical protein
LTSAAASARVISDFTVRNSLDQGKVAVSDSPVYGASGEIETRPCAKCRAAMALTRISTARLAFDLSTFECFNCDHVEKVMIKTTRVSPFARWSQP